MDNLRGYLGAVDFDADGPDHGFGDDEVASEPPPSPVGQDERRMQVRAYNHWASLLADRNFPSIEDLEPDALPDFGPNSVLLDFTNGIEDPSVRFLGEQLAEECDIAGHVDKLSDVPHRSLLTRITDHYMQILANQAPIGFEAEFVNQRGATILYRGILLPFSSDDDTIDFIYGVINWKQMADQMTSDELLLEIDQALEAGDDRPHRDPVTDWADGPGAEVAAYSATLPAPAGTPSPLAKKPGSADPFPLPSFGNDDGTSEAFHDDEDDEEGSLYESIEAIDEEPEGPSRFASLLGLGGGRAIAGSFDDDEDEEYGEDQDPVAKWLKRPTPLEALPEFDEGNSPAIFDGIGATFAGDEGSAHEGVEAGEHAAEAPVRVNWVDHSTHELIEAAHTAFLEPSAIADEIPGAGELAEIGGQDLENGTELGLYDCLAAARELALAARSCEDRSRSALYAAVGRAYDFSLAASAEPQEFAELILDSGLTVQDRAPMTPVVKLVFGADYDKTRLTEYAAVLTHAHRIGIERGALANYLGQAEGGLKGVVHAERALRRSDDDETKRETPREALARKLRAIAPLGFEDIEADGEEFALVMIRRVGGEIVVLGEVADTALVEKVARKLVA